MSQRNSWKDYGKKGFGFGKKGFDKAWQALDKLGAPVNRLSNRVGAEAFWPTTLDKESDKAARILRSFCKDGFYDQIDADAAAKAAQEKEVIEGKQKIDKPIGKQRVLVKIPTEVIKKAKGIAIFTTMRTGLWFSGAGGSGVLLARVPETGEWSPPSGILLHTAAIGFLVGVDIYDCVVIINTYEALEGFKKLRATLGGELSATAGPVGAGGILDSEVHKRQAPIWTYMKSRGLYAGVQVDGTIIVERTDENARFYGRKISAHEILAGKITHPPDSIRTLMRTLKAAQGDQDVSESELPPAGEAPADHIIIHENESGFGVPAADDPDPYGVHALEEQGMFIREAGTHNRPSQEVFEFRPSPSSPIYNSFVRQSIDSSPRQSWRAKDTPPAQPPRSASVASSRSLRDTAESPIENPWDTPDTSEDHDVQSDSNDFEIHDASNATVAKSERPQSVLSNPSDESSSAANFSRPRLVTIPKRIPPALPPRNPVRRRGSQSTQGSVVAGPTSPSNSTHGEAPAAIDSSANGDKHDLKEVVREDSKEVHVSPEPAVDEEIPAVEKDEFHSTSTSPTEELKSLEFNEAKHEIKDQVKEDAKEEAKESNAEAEKTT
ncbi:DUF500 domain protein [Talaromyces stipitatus ATCC 10500]|uniref:DUF500 domain protein n=1 Tax=Talaromyces stipitatus (strain ATCC 10500 / CBS 375.48 / QM 6759 / NRRL 1006) TaxID=441959 RepID=B8MBT7_TALSN|nr:DUF500 domain protein [Talaromyces stipitatus ATCC 10500]EED18220.1 DUF500 domain protein [Talaromyces stipitatus ATCC 10500]